MKSVKDLMQESNLEAQSSKITCIILKCIKGGHIGQRFRLEPTTGKANDELYIFMLYQVMLLSHWDIHYGGKNRTIMTAISLPKCSALKLSCEKCRKLKETLR